MGGCGGRDSAADVDVVAGGGGGGTCIMPGGATITKKHQKCWRREVS